MFHRHKGPIKFRTFLFAVFVTWFIGSDVFACRCGYVAPDKELKQATVVFSGRVVGFPPPSLREKFKARLSRYEIPFVRPASLWALGRPTAIEVTRIWKGAPVSQRVIKDINGLSSCGTPMEIGTEYLIYATDHNSELINRLCSRTTALASAGEDLAYLGLGAEPPKKSRLSSLPVIFAVFGVLLALSLAGYLIVISREGQLKKENVAEGDDGTTITR